MTLLLFKAEHYLQKLIGHSVKNVRRKKTRSILITLVAGFIFAMTVLALTFSGIGIVSSIEAKDKQIPQVDTAEITASVRQDARLVAESRYTDIEKTEAFRDQLLITYSESIDKDVRGQGI